MTKQLTMEQKQMQDALEIKLSPLKDNVKIKRFLKNSKEVLSLQNNKSVYNSLYNAMQLIKTPEDCYNVLMPTLGKFLGAKPMLSQENKQTFVEDQTTKKQQEQNTQNKQVQHETAIDSNQTPDQDDDKQNTSKRNSIYDKQSPTVNNDPKLQGLTYGDLVSTSGKQQPLLQDYDQSADQLLASIGDSKQQFREQMNNIVKDCNNDTQDDFRSNNATSNQEKPLLANQSSQLNKTITQTTTRDVQTDEREPVAQDDDDFQVKVDSSMQHTTLPYQIDQSKQLTKSQIDQIQREFIEMYNAKLQASIRRHLEACRKLRQTQIQKAIAMLESLENIKKQINSKLIHKITDIDLKIFNQSSSENHNRSILNITSLYGEESNAQDLQDTFAKKLQLTQQLQESLPICDMFFSEIYMEMIVKKQQLLKKLAFALPMQKYIKLKQIVQQRQVQLLATTKRLVNIKQLCSHFLVRVGVKQLLDVKKQQTLILLYLYKRKLDMTTRVKKDLILSLCKLKLKQLVVERRKLNNLILRTKKLARPRLPIINKNITLVQTHLNFYIDQIHILRTKISKVNTLRQQLIQLEREILQRKKYKLKQRIFLFMKEQKMALLYQRVVQLKQRFMTMQRSKQ